MASSRRRNIGRGSSRSETDPPRKKRRPKKAERPAHCRRYKRHYYGKTGPARGYSLTACARRIRAKDIVASEVDRRYCSDHFCKHILQENAHAAIKFYIPSRAQPYGHRKSNEYYLLRELNEYWAETETLNYSPLVVRSSTPLADLMRDGR